MTERSGKNQHVPAGSLLYNLEFNSLSSFAVAVFMSIWCNKLDYTTESKLNVPEMQEEQTSYVRV